MVIAELRKPRYGETIPRRKTDKHIAIGALGYPLVNLRKVFVVGAVRHDEGISLLK